MSCSGWINKQLRHISGYLGCVNYSQLPCLKKVKVDRCWLVVNMEKNRKIMGHWVAMFVDRKKRRVLIFNPLGHGANANSMSILCKDLLTKQRFFEVVHNRLKVQSDTSQRCGDFAIFFILQQVSCVDEFLRFLTSFHICDLSLNDRMLDKINLTSRG